MTARLRVAVLFAGARRARGEPALGASVQPGSAPGTTSCASCRQDGRWLLQDGRSRKRRAARPYSGADAGRRGGSAASPTPASSHAPTSSSRFSWPVWRGWHCAGPVRAGRVAVRGAGWPLAASMDKALMKALFARAACPRSTTASSSGGMPRQKLVLDELGLPVFVKPQPGSRCRDQGERRTSSPLRWTRPSPTTEGVGRER